MNSQTEILDITLESIERLSKDLATAAKTLGPDEARYMFDAYYSTQMNRLRDQARARALTESGEPCSLINWSRTQNETYERQIARALGRWVEGHPMGEWLTSIIGIGPILAAGLLSHLNVERTIFADTGDEPGYNWEILEQGSVIVRIKGYKRVADKTVRELQEKNPASFYSIEKVKKSASTRPTVKMRVLTVGHWWSFAGLNPNQVWEKGKIRPWCADLKRLAYILGDCFIKQQNNEKDIYGKIFTKRKAFEWEQNVNQSWQDNTGSSVNRAAEAMQQKQYGKNTEAYNWYSGNFDSRIVKAYIRNGVPFHAGITRKLPTIAEIQKMNEDPDNFWEQSGRFWKTFGPSLTMAGFPSTSSLPDPLVPSPMLCPAHVHARARRYAVKRFLSHFHTVYYWQKFGEMPPLPYVFSNMDGHIHYDPPPNTHLFPGLTEACEQAMREIASKPRSQEYMMQAQ